MKGYLPRKAKPLEDMSAVELEDLKAGTAAMLRTSLAVEVSEQDTCAAKSMESDLKLVDKQRKHNRHFLEPLDGAILGATGHGLSHFIPRKRLRPLSDGVERFLCTMVVLGEASPRKRMCVRSTIGEKRYELPLQLRDGVRVSPTLHLSSDQGPIGMAAQQFPLCRLGLRGTTGWDILHRLHGAVMEATASSGLVLIRFLARCCRGVRFG